MKPISYTDPFNYNFRMNYTFPIKRKFNYITLPKDIWVVYNRGIAVESYPRNGIDSNIVVRSIYNGS